MASIWECVIVKGLPTLQLYWRSWVAGFMSPFNCYSLKSVVYIYIVIYTIALIFIMSFVKNDVTENVVLFCIFGARVCLFPVFVGGTFK